MCTAVSYVPDDYSKIQWAVDNATAGDTIIVRDGVYVENVDVDKSLTIVSENGTANCTVQAVDHGHAFNVSADRVTITGFTVKDAMAGIYIQADNCNITKNICLNNDHGILLIYSNNNSITDNYISLNNYNGIYLYISSSNILWNNTVFSNNGSGIYVDESFNNVLNGNNVSSNNESGILVEFSINNTVEANNVTLNDGKGVDIQFSNNTKIMDNTIYLNEWEGIAVWSSHNNTIYGNNVSSNDHMGITIGLSNDNIIAVNIVSESHYDGIDVSRADNNSFIGNSIFSNNWDGIDLDNSNNSLVINNSLSGNDCGVLLGSSSSNNTVKNNTAVNNTHGICVFSSSSNNLISGNNASLNSLYGIYLSWSSDYNTIADNEILNNKRGIQFNFSCMYNTISSNNIFSSDYGIYFHESTSNNEITDNNVSNNKIGARLWNTTGNVFTRNHIGNNINYSFYIESSDIRVYLNNFFNSSVYSDSSSWWNSTEMLIYEFNGSTFRNRLGNYWSDYNGSDSNLDGIGEEPYNVNVSIPEKDFYPLIQFMENFTLISIPDLTVEDITIPKMEPGKNSVITVIVSNTGTDDATANVSLEVENSIIESKTLQLNAGQAVNLAFNWTPPGYGTYSIEIEVDPDDSVSEFNETNNNISTIVTVSSPPSGSSQPARSGGGGGGGTLTLKPPFIAPYEYYESFVRGFRPNETLVIAIPSKLEEDIGISELGIMFNKTFVGTASISWVLSLPDGVSEPEGEVYTIFEFVCVKYGSQSKVEPSGYINFMVSKEWLSSVGAEQSDVKLLKHNGKEWIEIPVELTGEDENYYYFSANLEFFSIFSIVAKVEAVKTTLTPAPAPIQVETETPEPIETLESQPTEIITPTPAFSTEMIVTILVIISATAVLLYVARRK